MPVQIVGVDHKLTLRYVVDGLTHGMSFWVNAIPSGDSTGFDLQRVTSGSEPLSTVITEIKTLFEPLTKTGTTGGSITLYEYAGGAFIPVYTGSWSLTPSGGTAQACLETTLFYRGGANTPLKQVFIELAALAPTHSQDIEGIGDAFENWVEDMLNTANGHFGSWALTKNGHFGFRWVSFTTSLSRHARRKRGLV